MERICWGALPKIIEPHRTSLNISYLDIIVNFYVFFVSFAILPINVKDLFYIDLYLILGKAHFNFLFRLDNGAGPSVLFILAWELRPSQLPYMFHLALKYTLDKTIKSIVLALGEVIKSSAILSCCDATLQFHTIGKQISIGYMDIISQNNRFFSCFQQPC